MSATFTVSPCTGVLSNYISLSQGGAAAGADEVCFEVWKETNCQHVRTPGVLNSLSQPPGTGCHLCSYLMHAAEKPRLTPQGRSPWDFSMQDPLLHIQHAFGLADIQLRQLSLWYLQLQQGIHMHLLAAESGHSTSSPRDSSGCRRHSW
jgi:hypothetical protein